MKNTSIKVYWNGNEVSESPITVDFGNNPVRIGFISRLVTGSIKIANFKEYYL